MLPRCVRNAWTSPLVVSVSNHEQNHSSFDTLRTSGMYWSARRSTLRVPARQPWGRE